MPAHSRIKCLGPGLPCGNEWSRAEVVPAGGNGLERISKPGIRRYVKAQEVPRVRGGLGVVILSTSRGIMTGRDCRREGVGGEVLCTVW